MPEFLPFAALFVVLFDVDPAVALAVRRAVSRGVPERRPRWLDDRWLRCPACETEIDPDYRFCQECVAELRRSAPSVPTQPAVDRSPFR